MALWEQKSHEEPEELTEETKRIYLDVLEQQWLWLQNKNNTDEKSTKKLCENCCTELT